MTPVLRARKTPSHSHQARGLLAGSRVAVCVAVLLVVVLAIHVGRDKVVPEADEVDRRLALGRASQSGSERRFKQPFLLTMQSLESVSKHEEAK